MNNLNKDLNKLNLYRDTKCILCGRKYPNTILNIEGHIHHNAKYKCIDVKNCQKYRKGI